MPGSIAHIAANSFAERFAIEGIGSSSTRLVVARCPRVGLNRAMSILLRVSGVGEVVVGLVLLLGPTGALEVVTTEVWQVELLRYLGLIMVPLGVLLGLENGQRGGTPHPVLRRVGGAWILLAIYVFTTTGLLLILGFSLLMASTLEVGLARTSAYSESLRRKLDLPGQPPQ